MQFIQFITSLPLLHRVLPLAAGIYASRIGKGFKPSYLFSRQTYIGSSGSFYHMAFLGSPDNRICAFGKRPRQSHLRATDTISAADFLHGIGQRLQLIEYGVVLLTAGTLCG